MKQIPLRIGNLVFEYPFVLAPLAGITDRSMRSLCSQAGASLTFTEMVSAKGLWYGDRKTGELLQTGWDGSFPPEGPVGYQIFGCEPEILEYAVRILARPAHAAQIDREICMRMAAQADHGTNAEKAPAAQADREADTQIPASVNRPPMGARTVAGLRPPALFDLNAGCPVPKIVRNGEGSALLKNPDLLYDCIAAMVKAADSIPVTVKVRKGFDLDDDCAVEIARAAEAAGAAAITVHGRTRQQFYEGKADWDAIARVKAAVNIPVIGNGDIYSAEDAIRMMEETDCDGVMIARGALGNPWIFSQARALWDGLPAGAAEAPAAASMATTMPPSAASPAISPVATQFSEAPAAEERIRLLLHHIDLVCEDKGERVAVREMRKHVGWYIKGMRGATQIRRQINTASTIDEMKQILSRLR